MPQSLAPQQVPLPKVIGRPFPEAPLLLAGRSRELTDLALVLGQLGGDRSLPPLLITGAAGAGKTRLAQEVLSRADVTMVRVVCPPNGGLFFHVPSTLIRLAMELPVLPSSESAQEAIGSAARRYLSEDPHAPAFLGLLLGIPLPQNYIGLDPRSARLSAFAACRSLLLSPWLRAGEGQVVLLVEDLQWADAGSIEFLEHLTRSPLPPRFALVATSRPGPYPDPKRGRGEAWQVVPLEPLLTADARDLLGALSARKGLPEVVESGLLEQSAGVPLTLEEEFLAMTEGGLLVPERLHYEFKGGPEELVAGRARPFTEDEREVLAALAVLAEDGTEPLIEEALGRPVELTRLVERGVLQRWVGPFSWSTVKFSFRHPTDQEIALAAVSPALRSALHRRGYERLWPLLDPSTQMGPALARALWHAKESGHAAAGWPCLSAAATLAERIGDLALEANLPAAAVDAYTDAIALRREGMTSPLASETGTDQQAGLASPAEWRARGLDVMIKRAEACVLLGRTEDVTRDVAAARMGFGEIGDRKRLCRAKLLLSRAYERAGDLTRVEEEASEASRIAAEAGDEEFVARAQAAVAEAFERKAQYAEALSHAEESRGRFERLAAVLPPVVLKGALAGVSLTIARVHADRGAAAEARAAIDAAVTLARAARESATLAGALELSARLLRAEGDLAHALLSHEEALTIAESRSDRIASAALWMGLGHLRRDAGDVAGAAVAFRSALGACREMGDRAGGAVALANVGCLAHDQGDLDAAAGALEEAAAIRAQIHDRVGGLTARLAWAEVEADRGRFAEARARIEEVLASARAMGARVAEARGLVLEGRILRHEGRHEEALAAHTDARDLAAAAGAQREAHEACVEAGWDALVAEDVEAGARWLEEAGKAGTARDARAQVQHAWLQVALRLALGQEALPLAEEALTLAHRAGLRRLVPHALDLCGRAAEAAGGLDLAQAYRSRAASLSVESRP
ncbi:MAG: AAA family ATPase [Planctomycetota bacterium]